MLERLEEIYLNALRVTVLAAATLSLVVFIVCVFQSGPLVGQITGIQPKIDNSTATLGRFISESRSGATSTPLDQAVVPSPEVPEDITTAARMLDQYGDQKVGGTDETAIRTWLSENYNAFPANQRPAYATSIRRLAAELVGSNGAPLSISQFEGVIRWHLERFSSEVAEAESKEADKRGKALIALAVAGVSMLFFLIVIFFFVVVKIERNLRVVRTRNIDA